MCINNLDGIFGTSNCQTWVRVINEKMDFKYIEKIMCSDT